MDGSECFGLPRDRLRRYRPLPQEVGSLFFREQHLRRATASRRRWRLHSNFCTCLASMAADSVPHSPPVEPLREIPQQGFQLRAEPFQPQAELLLQPPGAWRSPAPARLAQIPVAQECWSAVPRARPRRIRCPWGPAPHRGSSAVRASLLCRSRCDALSVVVEAT